MNSAYKNFLSDALYDFCVENGIEFADIAEAIDEQNRNGYIVSAHGDVIPCNEPNEYAYAAGAGCRIALAVDKATADMYNDYLDDKIDIDNIDKATINDLLEAWCIEINDEIANDSGSNGFMAKTLRRAAEHMGNR